MKIWVANCSSYREFFFFGGGLGNDDLTLEGASPNDYAWLREEVGV